MDGWRTLRERRRADDKAEWWRRTQWALEAALSEDETRAELGVGMLNKLAVSPLASGDDLDVLIPAWDHLLADIPPVPSGARVVVDEGGEDDGSA